MAKYFVVENVQELDELIGGDFLDNERPWTLQAPGEKQEFYSHYIFPLGLRYYEAYDNYNCGKFYSEKLEVACNAVIEQLQTKIDRCKKEQKRIRKIKAGA